VIKMIMPDNPLALMNAMLQCHTEF